VAASAAVARVCHARVVNEVSLLLVEDDRQLSAMLTELLSSEGYQVSAATDGHTALHWGLTRPFDILVVDRGLPAIEGIDLIGRLRSRGISAPALVLTARGTLEDRIEGLDAGADDYLVKPFEVEELLARLRALLRRHSDGAEVVRMGRAVLDVATRRVVFSDGSAEVELSGREADLLNLLAHRPRQVFTRDELLHKVFDDAEQPGAVDTYVHYLRRKLGRDVIRTVHGVGYRMGSL
jgi:DNA-binding response OmpR family regulator